MELDGFTSKDICAIIKECAKSGVLSLKFGELQVEFEKTALSNQTQAPEQVSQVVSVFPAPKDNEENEVIEQAKIQDTADALEDELATLQITDPHEYEELMFQGALEDGQEQEEKEGQ